MPQILGIVNITEDSFSDGGKFLVPEMAVRHALALVQAGADIIDLGPASSHPNALPVTPEEEISRLAPVMEKLRAAGVCLSVDSFHPQTQLFALEQGAGFLNDIQGFPEPEIYSDLARSKCRLIVMHSIQGRGVAQRRKSDLAALPDQIGDFFENRIRELERAGIARERLILDPGMGLFVGSQTEASLIVLRRLRIWRETFGLPLLISVSRKSFLRSLTGREIAAAGPATLAAELFAAMQGVDYIRTHDAGALRDGLKIWSALQQE